MKNLRRLAWLSAPVVCVLAAATIFPADARVGEPSTTAVPPNDFSGADLVSPGRGQYRWGGLTKWGDNDGEYFPNSSPELYDPSMFWPGGSVSYYRFNWRQLEPSEGQYDFAAIDRKIEAAASRGERFAFRVMVVDSCCSPRTSDGRPQIFPDWLRDRINGWTFERGDEAAVIPDWNDEDYLAAMERLIQALGQRYDRDDRIAYVDMNGYGNYGEWHLWPWEGTTGPDGQGPITNANAERLVRANMEAFPNTTVLSLTTHEHAFAYTMANYPRAGLRLDCVGDAAGGWAWPRMLDVPTALERWKAAPLVTEWCGSNYTPGEDLEVDPRYDFMLPDVGRDLYAVGRGQVMRWHLSLLSSGNFPHAFNGTRMTDQQFTDWSMANKTAGYRYSAALAEQPDSVAPGQSASISTEWTNAGVAPTYESWAPVIEIRPRGETEAVAQRDSNIDLTTLYAESTPPGSPLPAEATKTVTDTVQIPSGISTGTYDIVVVVGNKPQKPDPTATMPESFYGPVPLDQGGRTPDGHFKIGEIAIR